MLTALKQPRLKGVYIGDHWLLLIVILLVAFGIIMMASASIEIAQSQSGDVFYYMKRQVRFLLMGGVAAGVVLMIPVAMWKQLAPVLFLVSMLLLVMVLIPGIGHEVNGSARWINLGVMNVQASEPAKLLLVISLAGYLEDRNDEFKNSWGGFLLPFVFLLPIMLLLLKEPDFGAVVVLMIAVFGMMFLAGAKLYRFVLIIALAGGAGAGLIFSAEYRMQRLLTFVQSLADPFNESVVYGSGYQLAQALIAFGRGEWFGVGLGNSIQKIYFLPEAHTDFVLAIIAEELGLTAILALVALFTCFIVRAMLIARENEEGGRYFAAYMAYGITFLFAGQVVINMAVNVGLLPTKGLTLPFLSYGGSSLIICLVMVAMLLRIDMENRRGYLRTGIRS